MSTIDPDYRGCDADRAMPFDITQIARQHQFFQNAMGASYSAVQSFREALEDLLIELDITLVVPLLNSEWMPGRIRLSLSEP